MYASCKAFLSKCLPLLLLLLEVGEHLLLIGRLI